MIAEHIQNQEKNSRGRACYVLYYIFDTDENGFVLNNKPEDIEFIGTSTSIITADPFVPLRNYSTDEQKHLNLDDIKCAFEDIEAKNKRVKQPFKHIAISLREGESLTKSEWNELVSDYVNALGYTDNHWVAVLHKTKNHHAHIVVSCIENSAPHKKTKDGNDFARSAKIRNTLEEKFNLSKDNNPFVTGVSGNKVNNSHYKDKIQSVRDSIDSVLIKSGNTTRLPYFVDELAENGVGCCVKLDGFEIEGLSYSVGVSKFKGSSLGIGYSWPELKKRGLVYSNKKDLDDVLYSNERERAVSQLIENAYLSEDIFNDRKDLNQHYLLEPNNEFPECQNLHKYSVFRLITPLKSAKDHLLSTAKQNLKKLQNLRKNLFSLYDFIYRFSTVKIDSIMRYTSISEANLQFLFEQTVNQPPINRLIKKPSNRICLEKTGLLLVSADDFNNDSSSSKDYSLLDSAAERQNSIYTENTVADSEIINGVTIMGDYKTDNIKKSPTNAPVTILADYHNNTLADEVIEVQDVSEALTANKTIRMKPEDDSSFSF